MLRVTFVTLLAEQLVLEKAGLKKWSMEILLFPHIFHFFATVYIFAPKLTCPVIE